MRESQLQAKVMRYLRDRAIMCYKIHDTYTAGIPDILVIIRGQAIWFELKSDKGKLSKIQIVNMTKLLSAGCSYYVIRTMDELKSALKKEGV